jgi:hypothetical protein
MKLFISAQDITSISFGQVESGRVQEVHTVVTHPEGYLVALQKTLEQWDSSPQQIQAIYVVTGPGSFTASRVSTTIANALAFSQGIPLIACQNPGYLPLQSFELPMDEGRSYTTPTYGRPPGVTLEKIECGDNTVGQQP